MLPPIATLAFTVLVFFRLWLILSPKWLQYSWHYMHCLVRITVFSDETWNSLNEWPSTSEEKPRHPCGCLAGHSLSTSSNVSLKCWIGHSIVVPIRTSLSIMLKRLDLTFTLEFNLPPHLHLASQVSLIRWATPDMKPSWTSWFSWWWVGTDALNKIHCNGWKTVHRDIRLLRKQASSPALSSS
jgi:hypothetical protein